MWYGQWRISKYDKKIFSKLTNKKKKEGGCMANVELLQGDCLELMKNIPDESIDMILADLPY